MPVTNTNSDSLGSPHAGKHGAIDTAILRRPNGTRIHRATLSPGCRHLPFTDSPQRHNRQANRQLAASPERGLAKLHFGEVKVETQDGHHTFEVHVCLSDLDPTAVQVELYANGVMGAAPVRQEMKLVHPLADASGRVCLQRGCICGSSSGRLYGAIDTALRWRGGFHSKPLKFCGNGESWRKNARKAQCRGKISGHGVHAWHQRGGLSRFGTPCGKGIS